MVDTYGDIIANFQNLQKKNSQMLRETLFEKL